MSDDNKLFIIDKQNKIHGALTAGMNSRLSVGGSDNSPRAKIITSYPDYRPIKNDNPSQPQQPQQMKNFIEPILKELQSNADIVRQTRQLKRIAPELIKSEELLVHSVMSPNDLTAASASIVVKGDDLTDVPDDILTEVSANLQKFWDDNGFQKEVADIVRECLRGAGSVPIMIVPSQNYTSLTELTRLFLLFQKHPELLHRRHEMEQRQLQEIASQAIGVNEEFAIYNDGDLALQDELELCCEALGTATQTDNKVKRKKGLESSVKHIVSELNKSFEFSTDVNVLTDNATKADQSIQQFDAISRAMFIDHHRSGFDNTATNGNSFLTLLDQLAKDATHEPITIRIPAVAVKPICFPGDVYKRYGCLVMLNEHNMPITEDDLFKSTDQNDRSLAEMASDVFSPSVKSSWLSDPNMNMIGSTASKVDKYKFARQTFDVVFNHAVKNKLNKIGFAGAQLENDNTLMNHLFYSSLTQHKVKMIFVPEPLMTYFHVDLREDGTGRSQMEDIAFPLTLKMSFLVSGVLGMMNSATPNRKFVVDLPETVTDVVKLGEMIKQEHTEKNRVPLFNPNPQALVDHANNMKTSFEFVRRGANAEEASPIKIDVDRTEASGYQVDTGFSDIINNILVQLQRVPPSALNELNEFEYSRSVASNHLMFGNYILTIQTVLIPQLTKHVRSYSERSPAIFKMVTACCDKITTGNKEEIVDRIIASIAVTLPPPQTSQIKAHMDDINSEISFAENMFEKLFPESLYPKDNRELSYALGWLKSIVLNKFVRDLLQRKGLDNFLDIPDLTTTGEQFKIPGMKDGLDIVATEIVERIGNLMQAVKSTESKYMPKDDSGDGSSGSGSSYGGTSW